MNSILRGKTVYSAKQWMVELFDCLMYLIVYKGNFDRNEVGFFKLEDAPVTRHQAISCNLFNLFGILV